MEAVNRFPKTISAVELRAVAPAATARIIADMAEGVIGNKMAIDFNDKKMFQRLQGIIAIGDASMM